jgi:hypothetical protein
MDPLYFGNLDKHWSEKLVPDPLKIKNQELKKLEICRAGEGLGKVWRLKIELCRLCRSFHFYEEQDPDPQSRWIRIRIKGCGSATLVVAVPVLPG